MDTRNRSPSSGFGSIDSYSMQNSPHNLSGYESPTDFSVYPSRPPTSRFYGKLAPSRNPNSQSFSLDSEDNSLIDELMKEAGLFEEHDEDEEYDDDDKYEAQTPGPQNGQRRRGRQSKVC